MSQHASSCHLVSLLRSLIARIVNYNPKKRVAETFSLLRTLGRKQHNNDDGWGKGYISSGWWWATIKHMTHENGMDIISCSCLWPSVVHLFIRILWLMFDTEVSKLYGYTIYWEFNAKSFKKLWYVGNL